MSTTTYTETNRQVVSDMYEAARAGDLEGYLAGLAPDVVVFEPGFLPMRGTYRGPDGLQALVGKVTSLLDLSGMQIDRVIADEDHVIVLTRVPIIGSQAEVNLAEMSIIRDGKVAEQRIFVHDAGSLLDA
jgi:ketosteroid isomerase-like protein